MRTFYLSLFLLVGLGAVSQNLPFTVGIPPAPGSNTVEAGKSITITPGYSTTPSGTYVFRIVSDRFINDPDPSVNNYNFIKSEDAYFGNITNLATATPFQKKISYQYFDGLGRPVQSISVKSSPDFRDVVVPITYDAYGRQNKQYMPYVVTNDGRFQPNGVSDQSTYYNQASIYNYKVQLDARPFSETDFEPSPLNRPLQDIGPGAAWFTSMSNNKSVDHAYLVNVDGTSTGQEKIVSWSITSVSLGGQTVYILSGTISYYTSGSLSIKSTTDEQGHAVREYVDKLGKTILKKVQVANTPATYTDGDWALTYYIYDDFDRLRFVLPPEFITKISTYTASGDQGKSDLINAWCFQYQYDERGRMITKQVPGAEVVEMVYDKWDRLVASRDGNQKAANKWSFTKYDVLNRPIITGEISSSSSRATMVTTVNGISNRNETTATGSVGYTLNLTFPVGATISDVNTITFYDDYTWKANLSLGTGYDFQSQSGFTGTVTSKTRGLATGSKVRILNSSNFLITATYYDDQYRVLQSIGDDHLGNKNRTTNEYYGITGWVTKSLLQHGSALTSLSETDYDHTGRVMKTYLTLDGGTRVVTSQMQYNELGQLVDKKLHSTDNGSSYLQSVDYRYNIRGWLKSINNGQLTVDNDNDDANDLFGMNLNYEQTVSINGSNTTGQFNGNISSINWSSNNLVDPTKQKIYGYAYDNLNRLTLANYAAKNGGVWNMDVDMFNEGLSYDKNGNIKRLKRTALMGGSLQIIDSLRYGYVSGNKLTNVYDNSGYYDKNANNPDYGFSELIHSTGITEYTYDANGNMTTDLNKGITGITYNYLNKPTAVTLSAGTINYTYDAVGTKLKKIAGSNSSDYVGPIQYENTNLAFISLPEGRAVKTGTGWNYEYFLKDHLGNNRVVFGYENIVDSYTATMETTTATTEEAQFKNVAASRVQFASMNHTPNSYINPTPDRTAETNGYLGKPIGPAKLVQVHTGDTLNISAFAKYTTGTGGVTTVINNLVAMVAGAFGIGSGETAYTALNNNLPGIAAGLNANTNVPKAYLFYILYNSTYTTNQFGFQMVSNVAQNAFEKLTVNVVIPAGYDGGYLYTYVANESNVASASSMYFDDMTVRHWQTAKALQVTQITEYYPFGLAINPLAYNRSATHKNDYLYNGKELQDDFGLGWEDYGARMYMAELGRWISKDPAVDLYLQYSPYNFVRNNPIHLYDVNGMYDQSLVDKWEKDDLESNGFDYKSTIGSETKSEDQRKFNLAKSVGEEVFSTPECKGGIKFSGSAEEKAQYIKDIMSIKSNSYAETIFNNVASSCVEVIIRTASGGWFNLDGTKFANSQTYINGYKNRLVQQVLELAVSHTGNSFIQKNGVVIDYAQIFNYTSEGVNYNSDLILIHELKHTLDLVDGTEISNWRSNRDAYFNGKYNYTKWSETRAMHAENYLRVHQGDKNIRRLYGGSQFISNTTTWKNYIKP